MTDHPDEKRTRRKKTGKRAAEKREARDREVRAEAAADLASAQADPRPPKSLASLATLIAVVVAVVAIPLYLKSRPTADAGAEPAPTSVPGSAATPATSGQALPRFVDLGTTTCIPCKVMLDVMEELKRDYPGAFIVDFVNVKEDPDETARYNIRTIPTQIFYAPDGRELYRHVGVFRAEEIIAKWAELGYHFERATEK